MSLLLNKLKYLDDFPVVSLMITSVVILLLRLLSFLGLFLLLALLFSFGLILWVVLQFIQHIALYCSSRVTISLSFLCFNFISFFIILLISSIPFDCINISIFFSSFNNESIIINPLHLICILFSSFKLTRVFKSSIILTRPPFITIYLANFGSFKAK